MALLLPDSMLPVAFHVKLLANGLRLGEESSDYGLGGRSLKRLRGLRCLIRFLFQRGTPRRCSVDLADRRASRCS